MTGTEIAALGEAAIQLVAKLLELRDAMLKGDVGAAEALKSLTDHESNMSAVKDELHEYLDKKFDGSE